MVASMIRWSFRISVLVLSLVGIAALLLAAMIATPIRRPPELASISTTAAFWPIYFMLVYTIAGLWIGPAFVAIGLGVTAFTLIGYFFSGAWFDLWIAVANGGGLMLGGLWMRRS